MNKKAQEKVLQEMRNETKELQSQLLFLQSDSENYSEIASFIEAKVQVDLNAVVNIIFVQRARLKEHEAGKFPFIAESFIAAEVSIIELHATIRAFLLVLEYIHENEKKTDIKHL